MRSRYVCYLAQRLVAWMYPARPGYVDLELPGKQGRLRAWRRLVPCPTGRWGLDIRTTYTLNGMPIPTREARRHIRDAAVRRPPERLPDNVRYLNP